MTLSTTQRCCSDCGSYSEQQYSSEWKPMSKRPLGRPKLRWEDDVSEDIKSLNLRNWRNVAQDDGRK
jgi:hypothetical protein